MTLDMEKEMTVVTVVGDIICRKKWLMTFQVIVSGSVLLETLLQGR